MKNAEAARWFAQHGISSYPADPDSKRPLITGWNHNETAGDEDRAASQFDKHPNAAIGVAAEPSRLVIVDVDRQHNGIETFQRLCADVGLLVFEGCPEVATPSGGKHLYFRTDEPLRGGSLGRGIDVITNTGVLAPPSRRSSGAGYKWRTPDGEFPDEFDPPVFPDVLAKRMRHKAVRSLSRRLPDAIADGQRNAILAQFGGRLRALGFREAELVGALRSVNDERCRPPLDDSEVQCIAKSMAQYEAADVEPVAWFATWQRAGLEPQELRLAGALMAIAANGVCPLTPATKAVCDQSKMEPGNYCHTRKRLVERGALQVTNRGRKYAPIIRLLLPDRETN